MSKQFITTEKMPRKSIALLLSDNPTLPGTHPTNKTGSMPKDSAGSLSALRFELLQCNENVSVLLAYNNALISHDLTMLNWFALHGRSVRQQVINIESRILAKRYGYKIKMPASPLTSWISRTKWSKTETISLVHPADRKPNSKAVKRSRTGTQCEIRLASGSNGLWAFALNYMFAHSGQGSMPSYSDLPYNSRIQCVSAALDELEANLLTLVQQRSSTERPEEKGKRRSGKVKENVKNDHRDRPSSTANSIAAGKPDHRNQTDRRNALKILQSIEDMRLKLFPKERQLEMF